MFGLSGIEYATGQAFICFFMSTWPNPSGSIKHYLVGRDSLNKIRRQAKHCNEMMALKCIEHSPNKSTTQQLLIVLAIVMFLGKKKKKSPSFQ